MTEPKLWWGRFKVIKGKMTKQWVGPITEAVMRERYPDYRHMCSATKPPTTHGRHAT